MPSSAQVWYLLLVRFLHQPCLRQSDSSGSVVPEVTMQLTAPMGTPSLLDTRCALLPLPVLMKLLKLDQSILQQSRKLSLESSANPRRLRA